MVRKKASVRTDINSVITGNPKVIARSDLPNGWATTVH